MFRYLKYFKYLIFILNDSQFSLNNRILIIESLETQLHEYPRAASEDVANAFIADMFENTMSPLFQTATAGLRKLGQYSYAIRILPRISNAVSALFASNMIFFSA